MPIKECDVHIRWMIRRDMQEVLAIESRSFEFPWAEEDFISFLRQRNAIGMVADYRDRVVGYMVYEIHKSRLHLVNIAVHPGFRREGVGKAMLDKLSSKLSSQRRVLISLHVRETNLDAQLFFKSCGFFATTVVHDFYDDTSEDAYRMEYRLAPSETAEHLAIKEY